MELILHRIYSRLFHKFFAGVTFLFFAAFSATAQITVTDNKTAMQLANALIGAGVTISSAALNCPGGANGIYTTGAVDPVGIPSGIVLSNGLVIDSTLGTGLANPASSFASYDWGTLITDPDLATLTTGTQNDVCYLSVTFTPAGDTVRFNYVFGSEEYPDYACTDFNDVFGFFISGGVYATPTNLALIPGTTIPVCINSINCGAGALGTTSTCTALGGASPYCTYYIDNSTSSYLVLNGITTVMTAAAAVTPCTPYTIKMAICDITDGIFDSDVFIEGGSLTSPAISGVPTLCIGGTTTLSIPSPGGSWSSGTTSVATIGTTTGVVYGVSGGVSVITYTMVGGCVATYPVTVGAASIAGTLSACAGATVTLTPGSTGGAWSSSTPVVATVGASSGVVYAVSGGTTNITYTNPSGCLAVGVFTVNPLPGPIIGTTFLCAGSTSTLSNSITGGTWTSSNPTVASIAATTGTVSGLTTGTATITYVTPLGCSTTMVITVDVMQPVTGTPTLCQGSTTTLTDIVAGGTWTVGSSAVATIDPASGVVYGVSPGTSSITYASGAGCVAYYAVTVYPTPAAIAGVGQLCVGATDTLTDATGGGTWSSSNSSIAFINSLSGIIGAASGGTVTISYTTPLGCVTTMPFVANPIPVINGNSLCLGATATLTATPTGGTWTSMNPGIATVGSTTGIAGGVSSGSVTVEYVSAAGCSITGTVTVFPVVDPITGNQVICQLAITSLSDATPGGTWTISSPAVAEVDAQYGTVTGVSGGTTTVTYTSLHGCTTTYPITVNPNPVVSIDTICIGNSIIIGTTIPGGTWTTPGTDIISLDAITGMATGVKVGSTIVTYTTPATCVGTAVFLVVADPPFAFYVKPDACVNERVNVALTATGSGVSNYVWNFDGAVILDSNSSGSGPYDVAWPDSGLYVVQLDASGTALCPNLHTQDTIMIHKNPVATIQPPIYLHEQYGMFCLGDSVLLSAGSLDQNNYYFWQPINFFEQNNRSFVYGRIYTAGYVTLTVNNPYGCTATDSIYLNPQPCCQLTFPNAFSPNGDGLNDIFRPIVVINQPVHVFVIVNRWGQVVYEADSKSFGWDGFFNGEPQDIGTYYYYISYDCNGELVNQKGDVTLVR
jgi:gliding motility-associated-like protein